MAVKYFKVAENQIIWDTFVDIKTNENTPKHSISQYKPIFLAFDETCNKSLAQATVQDLAEFMEARNGKNQVHLNGLLLTCINNDLITISNELALYLIPENYKLMLGKLMNVNVEVKETTHKRQESYEYEGKTYTVLSELSEAVGMNYSKLKNRLDKGMSLDDAITFNDRSISYDGVTYKNETELAKAYNIEPSTYHSRKKEGWELNAILTTPVGKYERKAV